MTNIFATSFLARVPALLLAGMSIDEAIVEAKRQEDTLCLEMISALNTPDGYYTGGNYAACQEAARDLAESVYNEFRAMPTVSSTNIRYAIFQALSPLDDSYFTFATFVDACMTQWRNEANYPYPAHMSQIHHAAFDLWLLAKYPLNSNA